MSVDILDAMKVGAQLSKITPELRGQAYEKLIAERDRTLRLFDSLVTLIEKGDITPDALDDASSLEVELTGDCEAIAVLGRALGLSQYCDCDCWEEQGTLKDAGHLDGCEIERTRLEQARVAGRLRTTEFPSDR